jgi:hypothetical protein
MILTLPEDEKKVEYLKKLVFELADEINIDFENYGKYLTRKSLLEKISNGINDFSEDEIELFFEMLSIIRTTAKRVEILSNCPEVFVIVYQLKEYKKAKEE